MNTANASTSRAATAVALATPALPRSGLVIVTLYMFDRQQGFAVDSTGRLLSTADGGASLRAVASGANLLDVQQLDVLTPEVGWALRYDAGLDAGQVLRTEDGGRTWTSLAGRLMIEAEPTSAAPKTRVAAPTP